MAQDKFKSRKSFILACVGAAVGLGDSLRFPGLCARFGGGAFLLIYFAGMLLLGIPVLNAEIALGRKYRTGAPLCMKKLSPRAEKIGWASCFNSLVVAILYAGILGWIIAMLIKIVPLCGGATAMTHSEISNYFSDRVMGNGFSPLIFFCIFAAWIIMYFLLRGGAKSLSRAAKVTVLLPIVLLTLLAVRGLLYENSGQALYALFVPEFSAFIDAELWLNAIGQVFFSLSVLVGIMPAYGSYLPERTNVFCDSMIIAFTDFFVSVLSSVALFTTLYGCGLQNEITRSGIATAFAVYPAAITRVFGAGNTALNSVVGILFYMSLAMMAAQSAVSMIEAAANPIAEKFSKSKKKIAGIICLLGGGVSIVFAFPEGFAALDICDHFANYFNIIFLGVAECFVLGKFAKKENLAGEINLYTGKLKMPQKPFLFCLKYLAPISLTVLAGWGIWHLIFIEGGIYGGYPLWQQILFGWSISFAVFLSGVILSKIPKKSGRKIMNFTPVTFI